MSLLIEAEEARKAGAVGFMMLLLVQTGLPHSRRDALSFVRTNGSLLQTGPDLCRMIQLFLFGLRMSNSVKQVSSTSPAHHDQGITLSQAALVAGFGLLVMVIAAPFAEFFAYTKLVVPGDIEATVHNIRGHGGLYLAGIFAYLLVFICDVIVAWALYVLLIPVNRSLSLLTAWFRLVYTAIALFAMLKLVTVYRLLRSPDDAALFGSDQLYAEVNLLLDTFRYEWGFGLILFGIHLLLLGFLVYRSGYISRILGILLAIAGLGWVIYELSPFLLPAADPGFLMITFMGEVIFMLWLLIRGWKIKEP